MARLRITETTSASVPIPPIGKATIFLDSADGSFKAKLPNGTLIPISVTIEYIQDVVGQFFQDSSTIDITYDDVGNVITVEVIEAGLDVFQIPVTPTGNLTSNNVGDALNELQNSIDGSDAALQNHLDGGSNKHDATEVDYERANVSKNDIQNISIQVESALSDLDDNKLSRSGNQSMTGNLNMDGNDIVTGAGLVDGRDVSVDGTKLDTIESNAKDDQVASEVPVTPVGNLDSNNVQDGLEELQSDIDTINNNFEERAQDAVGSILQDTSTVQFNYNDVTNEISAIVPNAGITNAQIASGIDAVKIANGTVSNAEFERLAGITSNIQTQLNSKLNLSGGTMTGNLFLNADPTMDFQAATKRYVDNAVQGLNAKLSVHHATASSGNLASDFEDGDIVDGFAMSTGDRVLIKNQIDQSENGIYIVQASGAPIRSDDANTFEELVGAFIFISAGATLANTGWVCTATSGGVLETDPIPWVQFSSAGIITVDGEGLEKTGNEISLELDGGTLFKSATGLKVADSGIDTTQINNLAVTNEKISNLTITNAKIAAAAAIEFSKLQTLLSNRALVTNSSGVITASIITQTELEYLDNVTSNIQTQLNNKTPIDHLDGGDNKHDASEIHYQQTTLNKTDIQALSDDVENAVRDLDDTKLSVNGNNAMAVNLDMGTNDIINVGNIDGRDVSVDGTKLDTIETNAKDDQVASEVPVTPVGNISSTDVQAAINELDADKQPLDSDLTAISNLAGTGFITRTGAGTATTRTIQGTVGNIDVTNGDGISGNPTIDLPNVGSASSVGSASQSLTITTDSKGRVTTKIAQAISIVSSQVTDFAATVRSTVLTGLSLATSTAITATDTVLRAFGKLQAQVTVLFNRNINTGTGLQGGGNLTADRTLSLTDTGVSANTYGNNLNVGQFTVDAQGRLTSATNVPILFGQGYEYFEDLTTFNTNSATNQVAASFTTASLVAGSYRINLQWNFTINSNGRSAVFEMYVDGVIQNEPIEVEIKDTTDDITYNLFQNIVLTAGTHTIQLRTRMEGGDTVSIAAVKCDLWRVS